MFNWLFKKKQKRISEDPWDIVINTLKNVDENKFRLVFQSKYSLEEFSSIFPNIVIYTRELLAIQLAMESRRILPSTIYYHSSASINLIDFFTGDNDRYVDPIYAFTQFREAAIAVLSFMKIEDIGELRRNQVLISKIIGNLQYLSAYFLKLEIEG